ncbi:hypothetical protein DFA_04976 [Cavenderia fasciculata]|uniref:Uncharacterized protein n=1 Tax=Cavenderia fasciculata TaxID=261658 RepID=F4PMP9_CACFS|nr:uncharacterized protein DFA_04976 [Cavenderia fasciculata]EGG22846.1 hypothetical protein DFA_04976 [Cavenderia fasciculata]|eukprot:XP_004360697.1 hypothetical protein DFA_04976 [Cavenderia fasciculata]
MNNKEVNINNLFKSLLQSSYIRKKIFNHVEIIHQSINDSYKNHHIRSLKSNQIVTLCECIKVYRNDLFIKHFDSVYQSVSKDQHNYHLLDENEDVDDEDTNNDHNSFVGILTRHVVLNGDLEMFDRICKDHLDDISNKCGFYSQWESFGNLINKLTTQQQHSTNNNENNSNESKYEIIFEMVSKLILFGCLDLRSNLFIGALECDNNQEIIKWIRDSFDDSKEGFKKLCQESNVFQSIERYATTSTLELIDFKLQLLNSPILLSNRASLHGNLDFLTYMYDIKEFKPLFQHDSCAQLQVSLLGGHLECANFLITVTKQGGVPLLYRMIDPLIMSLDLVKRLVDSQCKITDFDGLIESAIKLNQPETLEFILLQRVTDTHAIYKKFVTMSLGVNNPIITEMLLDKFFSSSEGRPPQTFIVDYNDDNICYGPLLLLFNKGHTIEISPFNSLTNVRTKRYQIPTSPQTIQLLIDRLSIESGNIQPWVILSSVKHPDFKNTKLLRDTISVINQHHRQDLGLFKRILRYDILPELCKKGLVQVVECFESIEGLFLECGVRLFGTALQHKHIQLALFIGQMIATQFKKMDDLKPQILASFYFIDNDQDFEMMWDVIQPWTSPSLFVTKAISSSANFAFSQRHRVTNTIDRIIKHYTRYYNGPEKDQYNMTPLALNNELEIDPLNIHHLFNYYRDCPVIDFTDFNIDQYYIQTDGIIPFTKK